MSRQLRNWELTGFLFTAAAGVLLHFVFGGAGENPAAGAFAAVNESTWEHMKLLAMPALLFTALQCCAMGYRYLNFLAARGASVLAGTLLIPALFYTYTGILGFNMMWADIAIFFLADFFLFWLDFSLLRRGALSSPVLQVAGAAVLLGLLFCFVWCTYHPAHWNLWRDPVSGKYGIPRRMASHSLDPVGNRRYNE
jgi:hypothetical protein